MADPSEEFSPWELTRELSRSKGVVGACSLAVTKLKPALGTKGAAVLLSDERSGVRVIEQQSFPAALLAWAVRHVDSESFVRAAAVSTRGVVCTPAAEELSEAQEANLVFFPLWSGRICGALVLEVGHGAALTEAKYNAAHVVASVLGPVLELLSLKQQLAERRLEPGGEPSPDGQSACTNGPSREVSLEFLARASRILAESLDPVATLKSIAELVVPHMGDWCALHVVDEQGEIELVAVHHVDPGRVKLARQMVQRWPTQRDGDSGIAKVIRTGQALWIPRIEPEAVRQTARDEQHRQLLEQLRLCSAILVPLQARGQTLGCLTILSSESGREFTAEDRDLALDIAVRAGLALDNARLFREASESRHSVEQVDARISLLMAASDLMAATLDPIDAMKRLARFIVQHLADYCVTYSCDGERIQRAGLAHADPNKTRLVEQLASAVSPSLDDELGAGAVIRTGMPVLTPEVTDEMLRASTQNEHYLGILRQLAPRSSMLVPLQARERTVGAIAFVATDDSGRRYGQDDLRLALDLARRMALLLDNGLLYHEANRAVFARDQMIAVVSHDLKNPLNTIATSTAVLKLEITKERRDAVLDRVERAVFQMNRLVEDLLEVSRIDAGVLSISRAPTDVGELLKEAHVLMLSLAEAKAIRLFLNVPATLPRISADRGRLLQVLCNLVGNAIKHCPEHSEVSINALVEGEALRFEIADNGPGIAREHLAKVFDRFWQAQHNSRDGTGLGLAIAEGIVRAHGGKIGVRSKMGHGCTFFFLIPIEPSRLE